MFNLHQNLSTSSLAVEPESIIGWQGQTAITREMFTQKVASWHATISQIPQHKIALYLSDSIEFAAALFAAWHAHKTVVLAADTLENNCRNLTKEVDVFIGEFPDQYRTQLRTQFQTTLPTIANSAFAVGMTHTDFLPVLADEFPALIVYTSGSTGEAQAIPKQWSQLSTEIATLESLFGEKLGSATIYSTVSHQHIYGLLFKVLWPFATGRAIYADALNFPEQLQQHLATGACALIASPAHLKRLPAHLDWTKIKTQLRAVFSSGGPLSIGSVEAVQSLWGQTPIEVYGSSETGGIAWRQRIQAHKDAWQVFPQLAWRIATDNNLLEIQSSHLPDTAWFRLADQVNAIDQQHFQLLGRQDRIVKIEEKRISLDLMEKALLSSGLVNEARLLLNTELLVEQNSQRQNIYAFIVLTKQGQAILQGQGKFALNQQLRGVLSKHVEAIALPRRWRYLDALPVNSQGKTTHAQLLTLLESTEQSPDNTDIKADSNALNKQPTMPDWRLLEQEPERVLLEIIVPQNLLYFEGHFPIAPVLPGVVQVDWAIHFGKQYFALPANFCGIQTLKFQQVICAETPVYMELIHQAQKQALQFRYFSDVGQHAGGRVLFEQAQTPC
ncbi:AMP-binding protein [Undibacterium flavidum]|uniref:Acyl-CoA synthetase n=1 Tax=Undibacterium flavidum TaxID=2762297 RepID=A0ABR6YC44_9BURK|nr:AMP-binding protein [Undibacterium flavidum]MBC3874114.1 acyl-CoA synthetase [Undibacterium flavidum]